MIINKKILEQNRKDWEDLAELDIYWAILTNPNKKFGKWNIGDFFKSGEEEINRLMKLTEKLGYPLKHEVALDFGCGVGRVTRQLAKNFKNVYGIDISEKMILKARELNSRLLNCKFVINKKDNLSIFVNNYFDLIYSRLVLQHIPSKNLIKKYISEFVQKLTKGGLLIFQLPCYIPQRYKTNRGVKYYKILKNIGISKKFIYEKLKLSPLRMNAISEREVIEFLNDFNIKILIVQKDESAGPLINSRTYYITK